MWRVTLADHREQALLRAPLVIEGFRLAPDGTRAATVYRRENSRNGSFHDEVAVVDLATGALKDLTHDEAPERRVRWSPDGRTLSYRTGLGWAVLSRTSAAAARMATACSAAT